MNILYFLSSVKPLRLNHAKLKFHRRFCLCVGRTRLGCVWRQDTKNVWKYKRWSNSNWDIFKTVTIYRSALLPLHPTSSSPLLLLPSFPASYSFSCFSFHGLCPTSCSEWHTWNNLCTPCNFYRLAACCLGSSVKNCASYRQFPVLLLLVSLDASYFPPVLILQRFCIPCLRE